MRYILLALEEEDRDFLASGLQEWDLLNQRLYQASRAGIFGMDDHERLTAAQNTIAQQIVDILRNQTMIHFTGELE